MDTSVRSSESRVAREVLDHRRDSFCNKFQHENIRWIYEARRINWTRISECVEAEEYIEYFANSFKMLMSEHFKKVLPQTCLERSKSKMNDCQ